MKSYVGIDLHSTNNYISIVDENGNEIASKKLKNDISLIIDFLEQHRTSIESISVESTYNWYWLTDGLQEHNYPIKLANPGAIRQYSGIKNTNDRTDARFLAQLDRLNILPIGYIYPKEERNLRDLLRTRIQFVRNQTQVLLSLQSMLARHNNVHLTGPKIKALTEEQLKVYFTDQHEFASASAKLNTLNSLMEEIDTIEKILHKTFKKSPQYKLLLTVPGIGSTLAKVVLSETGKIERFRKVGNYASYCRCVQSKRISNGKKKGSNNRKNGNAYLRWAYLEAANAAIRSYSEIKSYYQKKLRRVHRVSAINVVTHKLANAVYFMLRDGASFDMNRLFG